MAYVALYRQWRPQTFGDVVGQNHISKTMKNAVKSGRISHAYIFAGPRGTGKTSSAKIMAKAVNCLHPVDGEPCGECASCLHIGQGNAMDIVEIDAASNRGIDEIRDLREKVKYAPVESKYKVYIIDEVHMLTTEAFNALLKTLEEPPKHVIFILATTEPFKVPVTVLSRCQRFDFKRIGYQEIVSRLAEICTTDGLPVSDRAMQLIARKAEGSMRDALSLLDQCVSFAEGEITEGTVAEILGTVDTGFMADVVEAIAGRDLAALFGRVDTLVKEGKDLHQFLHDLLEYLRNLLLVKFSRTGEPTGVPDYLLEQVRSQAERFSENRIFSILQVLGEGESQLRFSAQPRISLEINLIKAAGFQEITPVQEPFPQKTVLEQAKQSFSPAGSSVPESSHQGQDQVPPVDLPQIREQWKKVLETIRKQRPSTYAYLVEGEPVAVKGNKIILSFKPHFQLHMQNLDLPNNRLLVEKVLAGVFRQNLSVQGILAADDDGKKDLADEARALFGVDVVEIKE